MLLYESVWMVFEKAEQAICHTEGRFFPPQHAQCGRGAPDGSASVRSTPVALRRLRLREGLEDSGGDH
ncbi:hypothetical protein KOW79_007927 [Hemibagrus wyckioides]|uniref:Uncharacterized protein n=1 Tax=Hemibagrus wyckioides TaxID=337641 RepID=A0A9D3NRZ5_9TELE|nr:hypothetical protein KOW79_007927 [Hemibagrus wyckioides]